MKEELNDFIKQLNQEKKIFEVKIRELDVKIKILEEFSQYLGKKEKKKNIMDNIANSSQTSSSNFMDEKDIKKVNLFLEYMDKIGEIVPIQEAKRRMPRLEYYIYRKRIWKNWNEFSQDYNDWLDKKGYWENLVPNFKAKS
jgi:hypothetical protein